jgi:hypothetical protein
MGATTKLSMPFLGLYTCAQDASTIILSAQSPFTNHIILR